MRNDPLVTVIIPCYNQGKWLHASLEGVFASTYTNLEIIVVDDGSNDPETVRILDELDESRVRLIRQDNQGLCGARNSAIKIANGEFVLSVDSDDILDKNFIQHGVECFAKHPDVVMVAGDYVLLDDISKEKSEPVNGLRYSGYLTSKIMANNIITSNYIYRKSLVKKVGGFSRDLTRLALEDVDFTMRVFKKGFRIFVLPVTSLQYRQHGLSMNNNHRKRRIAKIVIFRHHFDWFLRHPAHALAFLWWGRFSSLLERIPYTI